MEYSHIESDSKHIDYIITQLTKLAETQISIVKALGFTKSLECDEHGYDMFRKIYEIDGNYIHPYGYDNITAEEKKARKLLYSNMSYEADIIFRAMMEEHYLSDGDMDETMKDNLYLHAYNQGHSCGYNEIHNYYNEIVYDYDNLSEDELMDKLDIYNFDI